MKQSEILWSSGNGIGFLLRFETEQEFYKKTTARASKNIYISYKQCTKIKMLTGNNNNYCIVWL